MYFFFYPSLICLSCNPPLFTHSFFTWQTVCSVLMMFSSSFIVGTITLHFLSVKLWRWICRAPSNTDKSSSVSCQITLKELEPTKQNKPELNEWCMKYFWGGGCTGFIFILLGQIISRQTRIEDVWLFFLAYVDLIQISIISTQFSILTTEWLWSFSEKLNSLRVKICVP